MFDFYDDPEGTVMSSTTAYPRFVDMVTDGDILSKSAAARLPDRLFALVKLVDGRPWRKYACADKANTGLSVVYFLDRWTGLTPKTASAVATNLITACRWYDLRPPTQLMKIALLGTAVMAPLMLPYAKSLKTVGRKQTAMHLAKAGLPTRRVDPADLLKTGRMDPYVGDRPGMPTVADLQAANDAAGRRPAIKLAGLDDIGIAADVYADAGGGWTPEQRRAFCVPLVKRAARLGMIDGLSEDIQQYGNLKVAEAEYISSSLTTTRSKCLSPTAYADYLLKLGSAVAGPSSTWAVKIAALDRQAGIRWSPTTPDPWQIVYGLCKQADYQFIDGQHRIDEDQLSALARAKSELGKHFEPALVNAFVDQPVKIFASLPLNLKRAFISLAKSLAGKTGVEND